MRRGVLIAGVSLIAFGLVMMAFYMLNTELNNEKGTKRLYPNGEDGIILTDLESGDVIYLDFESDTSVHVWISPTDNHLLDGELMATNSTGGSYSQKVGQSGSWYITFQNLDSENDNHVEYDIQVQNWIGQITLILAPVFIIFGAVVAVAGYRLEKIDKSEMEVKLLDKSKKGKPGAKGKTKVVKGKPVKKTQKKRPKATVFETEDDTFEPEPKEDLPAWDAVDRVERERRPERKEDTGWADGPKSEPEPPSEGFSGWAEEEKPEEPEEEEEEEEEKSLPCVMCGGRMFRDASTEWVCDRCGNRI